MPGLELRKCPEVCPGGVPWDSLLRRHRGMACWERESWGWGGGMVEAGFTKGCTDCAGKGECQVQMKLRNAKGSSNFQKWAQPGLQEDFCGYIKASTPQELMKLVPIYQKESPCLWQKGQPTTYGTY